MLTSDLADMEPRFAELSVPLMILIGTEDPVDSSFAAQPLAALLPESELHEFEGAGHVIHHSRQDEVLALLGDFWPDANRAAAAQPRCLATPHTRAVGVDLAAW